MTFSLGQRSLSFITHVDPRMIAVAKAAISVSQQDFGFTAEQSRTVAQERALMLSGASHTMHSHHIIDEQAGWAAPGYSGAIDAVAWDGNKFVWEWPRQYVIASAFLTASIATKTPITWGGCWGLLMTEIPGNGSPSAMEAVHKGPHGSWDGPHFELGRN